MGLIPWIVVVMAGVSACSPRSVGLSESQRFFEKSPEDDPYLVHLRAMTHSIGRVPCEKIKACRWWEDELMHPESSYLASPRRVTVVVIPGDGSEFGFVSKQIANIPTNSSETLPVIFARYCAYDGQANIKKGRIFERGGIPPKYFERRQATPCDVKKEQTTK